MHVFIVITAALALKFLKTEAGEWETVRAGL